MTKSDIWIEDIKLVTTLSFTGAMIILAASWVFSHLPDYHEYRAEYCGPTNYCEFRNGSTSVNKCEDYVDDDKGDLYLQPNTCQIKPEKI